METYWSGLWLDAEAIRDHISRWLAAQGVPEPFVYIREKPESHPQPSEFTFVAASGISQKTVTLASGVIEDNKGDLGLFGQSAAEAMLTRLLNEV